MDRQALAPAFELTRREIVAGIALLAAMPVLPRTASAQDANQRSQGDGEMGSGYVTTDNGTQIFFKDWGPKDAQPIVFHHGWPLTADDWDNQKRFFGDHPLLVDIAAFAEAERVIRVKLAQDKIREREEAVLKELRAKHKVEIDQTGDGAPVAVDDGGGAVPPAADAALVTCATSGRPAMACNTFGLALFMRVPSPAARIMDRQLRSVIENPHRNHGRS